MDHSVTTQPNDVHAFAEHLQGPRLQQPTLPVACCGNPLAVTVSEPSFAVAENGSAKGNRSIERAVFSTWRSARGGQHVAVSTWRSARGGQHVVDDKAARPAQLTLTFKWLRSSREWRLAAVPLKDHFRPCGKG